jgi:hypothetical protein
MKLFFFLALFTLNGAMACLNGEGFLPQNNLSLPLNHNFIGKQMTEATFKETIANVAKIYESQFQSQGLRLRATGNWQSSMVNGVAREKGRDRLVIIYGGFARHELVDVDELVLVTCHEIGHHLGGAPVASPWASSEAQADYFATSKCTRLYFEKYPKAINRSQVSSIVQNKCDSSFSTTLERESCMRANQAALNVSKLFAIVQKNPTPSFETPDMSRVTKINYKHPKAQCRLDTFLAGSICEESATSDFSRKDFRSGACTGNAPGARPECWFPKSLENNFL